MVLREMDERQQVGARESVNSLFSEGLDVQQHSERGKVYRGLTNQTFLNEQML